MQNTAHILMIRPVRFTFNEETAVNNAFQVNPGTASGSSSQAGHVEAVAAGATDATTPVDAFVASVADPVQASAAREFDDFVAALRAQGVDVIEVADTPEPFTPDSIFPNNWVSFHHDGTLVLYPMFAPNRRLERKESVIQEIKQRFEVRKTLDLTGWEAKGEYLEGTGSMVLDRDMRLAYACLSPRTDAAVLEDWCSRLQYQPILFSAVDAKELPIYHTNVMMCVADTYVVICLESIPHLDERDMVVRTIKDSGKALIPITLSQMNHFAGNMLQVQTLEGGKVLVMSDQAYKSLKPDQIETLESYNPIIHPELTTIETYGGGSARCMMAEVYLPVKA